ncbi:MULTISPECIES: MurR/RpiR family transcriptional regulator [Pasteurellaceae]|uniref:MurR/RpiR family transcriptional regulator n=1 Tax=Pasteurella atlantica TaxID=2827233 RepID=A0AAW8CPQ6_9PAST|nr:MurR/RpiR family transcriptional regulator [Pasteurella atlantica]MBR0573481.1 MurR/RpiR family transcriptional regulator [Pasteurella atlantica]MDP8039482.1 MurR/RpiR family transcriptional regulator [Pasteurella atlantica]MDP8041573.1 MurR/RpiR family transcriptional regulator [Pasteurella atlantica]MDP8043710.1 MurR/RpiR family transcriptional regulator [Pasteurella atlantica]MDP8045793.1 MurR/RpiR family transcriptional regulator [Pasteurella atlantica]
MQESSEFINLQNEIRLRYDTLSKRLKQVAEYVLDNQNSIVFETVAVIAEKANVPPSTLIRFANAFGFSGFNEMKQVFREGMVGYTVNYTERLSIHRQLESEDKEKTETALDVLNVYSKANTQSLYQLAHHTSLEQLNKAVDILDGANNIFIVGLKRSFSVACYLNYALHHLNCRSFIIDGLGGMFDEQCNQIQDGDVVVAISFSPYAEEAIEIMNVTAKKGIKQIAITDSQISPILAFSDVSFVVKEAQVHGFRSQCATITLTQTLALSLGLKRSS